MDTVVGSSRIVGVMMLAVFAAAGLSGCGKFYWGQPGATQEQFVRDNRECVKEAAPTPAAADYGIIYDQLYRACLSGRGWKREQHVNPPPGWYRGIE